MQLHWSGSAAIRHCRRWRPPCGWGVPTCIHEQNAVLGRANRLFASRVSAIAGSFPKPLHLDTAWERNYRLTGNPVRSNVRDVGGAPYETPGGGDALRVLVFGGSQGARVMSEIVPPALCGLGNAHRLSIVQQCRAEDLEAVRATYAEAGIEAEVESFFDDLPSRMAACHLAICRAGASTIAELSVIGRPAILVPLPHSLDQDQRENALRFVNAGGGWLMDQDEFTPDRVAQRIEGMLAEPVALAVRAEAALAFGRPDADKELADLVEDLLASR